MNASCSPCVLSFWICDFCHLTAPVFGFGLLSEEFHTSSQCTCGFPLGFYLLPNNQPAKKIKTQLHLNGTFLIPSIFFLKQKLLSISELHFPYWNFTIVYHSLCFWQCCQIGRVPAQLGSFWSCLTGKKCIGWVYRIWVIF